MQYLCFTTISFHIEITRLCICIIHPSEYSDSGKDNYSWICYFFKWHKWILIVLYIILFSESDTNAYNFKRQEAVNALAHS